MWVLLCYIEHVNWPCKGNERKSTCSGCMGEPGQFPAPSPSSVTRSRWGEGGGEWQAGSCQGSWAGEGGYSGKSIPQAGIAPNSGITLASRGLYIGKYPPPPGGGGNKYGLMGKKYHENNARGDKKGEKERKDKGKEKISDKKTEQEQCFIK